MVPDLVVTVEPVRVSIGVCTNAVRAPVSRTIGTRSLDSAAELDFCTATAVVIMGYDYVF